MISAETKTYGVSTGYGAAILTGIIGVIVSAALFVLVASGTSHIAETNFKHSADDRQADIQSGVNGYIKAVKSMQALLEISNIDIAQKEFFHIADAFRHDNPGVLDLSRAIRVRSADRSAFEAKIRASGRPNFQIRERDANGQWVPAGERPEYFPVLGGETPSSDPRIDGYDYFEEPAKHQALVRAAETGQIVSAEPAELIMGGRGFLSWAPIYRFGAPTDTVAQRRDNLIGYATLIVRISDMIESILTASAENEVDIYLSDPNASPGNQFIYWRPWPNREAPPPTPSEANLRAGVHWEGAVTFADRQWNMIITPATPLAGGIWGWEALSVLVAGLFLTGVLVAYLSISRRHTLKLLASEAELAEAQSIAHVGNWSFDAVSDTSVFSVESYRILGVEPGKFDGSYAAYLARIHPEDRPIFQRAFAESMAAHAEYICDYRIVMDDGTVKWVHDTGRHLYDSHGRHGRTYGTMQDITAVKRTEEIIRQGEAETRKSKQVLEGILNAIPVRVFWKNRNLVYLGCNEIFARDAGFSTPADLIGKDDYQMGWRHEADLYRRDDRHVIESGVAKHFIEEQQTTPDGKEITLLTSKLPLRGPSGEIEGVLGTYMDITDRKQAETRLRDSEERFRTIFNSVSDAVFTHDMETGRFLDVNRRVTELFGYTREDALRSDMGMLSVNVPPYTQADALRRLTAARSAETEPFEWHFKRQDGSTFWGEVTLRRAAFGAQEVVLSTIRDITDRKRRDDLLDAIASGAADMIESRVLGSAIPKVLERVASAAGAQRAYLLGNRHVRDGRVVAWERHEWRSFDLAEELQHPIVDTVDAYAPGFARWKILLDDGRPISSLVANLPEGEQRALKETGLRSIFVLPITINGQWWGEIGLGDCTSDRVWTSVEVDALRTLAEIVGTAATQAQYVKELTDANTIVENSPTILFRLAGEPSLPMMYISHNIVRFGHEPTKFLNTPGWYASLAHPEDREKLENAMGRALAKNAQEATVEFRFRTGTGAYRWVENRFTPVRDSAGRLVEIEGIIVDITERKAAAEKIELLARTDPLTGLANRATFNERLGYAFSAAKRGGSTFAVLYLDLDHFKDINDTLGHPAGDQLLKTVAERFKNNVRESDLVARLGGDEFAVLQTDIADASVAGVLAAKIQGLLAAPITLGASELHITTSIGISLYGPEVENAEAMLAQADLALYRAKEEGRNRYSFHSGDLDEEVRERVTLAEELRTAIDKDQFELYYQPQVELVSGRIIGMEALVRWNHPTRGILMPGLFLPIAEKTGSILALGRWVTDHACHQLKLWRDAGMALPVVAVNLSLAQIKSGEELFRDIGEILKKWGLAPGDLELDVTESMLAQATWAQNNILERLHRLGVRIALDDFGGEYSSLEYVRKYQVSHLKIAKPLVDRAAQEPDRAATIRAIVGLARDLGIDVIAEGVETENQRALLISMGSNAEAQGFYFSEPVPAERTLDLLRQGNLLPVAKSQPLPERT